MHRFPTRRCVQWLAPSVPSATPRQCIREMNGRGKALARILREELGNNGVEGVADVGDDGLRRGRGCLDVLFGHGVPVIAPRTGDVR